MSEIRRVGDLEIGEDIVYQRRAWAVERAGWVVVCLLLAAGLLGLCGSAGPLDRGTAGERDGPLFVQYPRFPRHGGQMTLTIRLGPESVRDGEARVRIDAAFLGRFQLESALPEPESVELDDDRLTYVFRAETATEPLVVTFTLRPERYGLQRGRIGIPDGPDVALRQFVYP